MNLKKLFSIKNLMSVLGASLVINAAIAWTNEFSHEEFVSYGDLGIKEAQYKQVTEARVSEPNALEIALAFGPDIPLHAEGFFRDRRYESQRGTMGLVTEDSPEKHCPRNLEFKKSGDGIQYRLSTKDKAAFSKSDVESCLRKMMYLVAFEHKKAVAEADMKKRQKERKEQEKKANLESWNT